MAEVGESRAFVTKCASLAIYALFRSIRRCQEQWRNYRSFREDSSDDFIPVLELIRMNLTRTHSSTAEFQRKFDH